MVQELSEMDRARPPSGGRSMVDEAARKEDDVEDASKALAELEAVLQDRMNPTKARDALKTLERWQHNPNLPADQRTRARLLVEAYGGTLR